MIFASARNGTGSLWTVETEEFAGADFAWLAARIANARVEFQWGKKTQRYQLGAQGLSIAQAPVFVEITAKLNEQGGPVGGQAAVPLASQITISSPDDSTAGSAGAPHVANGGRDLDLPGVVEPALSRALLLAAEAGQWALVSQFASELEARRVARQSAGDSGRLTGRSARVLRHHNYGGVLPGALG